MNTPIGLWIDDPPRRVLDEAYYDKLAGLGVSTAALMIDSSSPEWSPTWKPTEIERACKDLVARDVEVVLTTWPSPQRAVIDATMGALAEVIPFGAAGIEVDLEGQWKRSLVRDFADLEAASAYLVERMEALSERFDVRLELTTHTGHAELGPGAMVAPHVDRLLPQAYSTRKRLRETVEWGSKYGPASMQRFALDKARKVPGALEGGPRLACGLAAWSQSWPGHTVDEAMRLALETALEYEPCEIRYWSSKWVTRRACAPASFIAGLKG